MSEDKKVRSIVVETTDRGEDDLSKIEIYRVVNGEKSLLWTMDFWPASVESPGGSCGYRCHGETSRTNLRSVKVKL